MWHKYTIQYYSAMKNEILRFGTAWMDLVGVTLSEITQRKTNAVRFRLYVESKGQSK